MNEPKYKDAPMTFRPEPDVLELLNTIAGLDQNFVLTRFVNESIREQKSTVLQKLAAQKKEELDLIMERLDGKKKTKKSNS